MVKIKIVLGDMAVEAHEKGLPLSEVELNGQVLDVEFTNEGEKKAYLWGIQDAMGYDYKVVEESSDNEPLSKELKAKIDSKARLLAVEHAEKLTMLWCEKNSSGMYKKIKDGYSYNDKAGVMFNKYMKECFEYYKEHLMDLIIK